MDLVLRTIVVFVLILIVTRAVGRRELSSMEPFDLILLVVIGDLVQQGVTQSDYSLTGAATVIFTMAALVVVTAYLSFRFKRLRPLLEGEPTLLISDGRLLEKNLRRERMTIEEIRAEARQQLDRVAARRPLGGARDQREDQLPQREAVTSSMMLTASCSPPSSSSVALVSSHVSTPEARWSERVSSGGASRPDSSRTAGRSS